MASLLGDSIYLTMPGASPPIPGLLIDGWPQGGGYVRGEGGFIESNEDSINGVSQVEGGTGLEKYFWQIACHLTAADARRLGALIKWQDRTYKGLNNDGTPKARGDGRLILRDGVEMVDSEPSPHSRTLWQSYTEDWNASYVYGFAEFYVLLSIPPEHKKHLGQDTATGEDIKLVTFTLKEV